MSEEFKPIETQEEFNEKIKDRITRAESKVREEYKGYVDPDTYKDYIAPDKYDEDLKAEQDKTAAAEKDRDTYRSQVESLQTEALRTKIASEMGIPLKWADRIKGTTEEEMRKDAKEFAQLRSGAPLGGSGEPTPKGGNDAEQSMAEFIASLRE